MGSDEGKWRADLREARKRLSLSQRELAARAGVSYDALRSYETGKRHPSRPHLTAILDALQVDRAWRNRLLFAAGYAPDGLEQRPRDIDTWWLSPAEAAAEQERYEWPAFVLSERLEVLSANTVAQHLWGVDMRVEYLDPIERNLLSVATTPRFADRVGNWDEAVETILSMFKGFHRADETMDAPTPYFAAVIQHFMKGGDAYVGKIAKLWDRARPEGKPKIRWTYPVDWREPGVGPIRFRCMVSTANEVDGLALNDWMPIGPESWANLARILELPRRRTL